MSHILSFHGFFHRLSSTPFFHATYLSCVFIFCILLPTFQVLLLRYRTIGSSSDSPLLPPNYILQQFLKHDPFFFIWIPLNLLFRPSLHLFNPYHNRSILTSNPSQTLKIPLTNTSHPATTTSIFIAFEKPIFTRDSHSESSLSFQHLAPCNRTLASKSFPGEWSSECYELFTIDWATSRSSLLFEPIDSARLIFNNFDEVGR